MTVVVVSFLACLAAFTIIGAASALRAKKTTEDYLVAGRGVGPGLVALSSVATNNSGFMFVGLIGYTYTAGISGLWLQAGWVLGDLVVWSWVHRRVSEEALRHGHLTVPALLGRGPSGRQKAVVRAAAVLTLVFLSVYAAAQLKAGSKALYVLFGWDYSAGAIIGAAIVLVYCIAGGIRASIWTDVAQSVVMLAAMAMLLVVANAQVGGPVAFYERLAAIDPQLVELAPQGMTLGFVVYFIGWMGGGFGVVGQPHILIRTMALEHPSKIRRARAVYFAWFVPFSIAAVAVGLYARVLIPDVGQFDAELALPTLSLELLPEVLVGLVLAALFAATMSTADSQILSCSAAITQDLVPQGDRSFLWAKVGTVLVTAFCLLIALEGPESVFVLVLLAWSTLASTLGPLLVVRLLGLAVSSRTALAMMASGFAGMWVWRYDLGLAGSVYEIVPGMLTGFAAYAVARVFSRPATEAVTEEAE